MKANQQQQESRMDERLKDSVSYQAYMSSPYKSIKHSTYFNVYDELFSRYRGKDITFVEIGVFGGGSLFMWKEFFGPKARIIGIDLNPDAKNLEKYGFEIYIGSQSDENFWTELLCQIGLIDVALDDGGHTYLQQIVTTEMLLPNIKDGGMLVIEDTHTSYMDGYGPRKHSFLNYTKYMIDSINGRFSGLNQAKSNKRIFSIQSYESIIAFHVDTRKAALPSHTTTNNGIDTAPANYVHHGNKLTSITGLIPSWARNLKRIKFINHIGKKITSSIYNNTGGAGRLKYYFSALRK
jgi:hypothetical protein